MHNYGAWSLLCCLAVLADYVRALSVSVDIDKRFALVTMVSADEYVLAANVLLQSARKQLDPAVLSRVTCIALLIEEHNNTYVKANLKGWERKFVPLLTPPFDGAVKFHRFKEQFTKLHVWNMTEFDRIVYLDSDCFVVADFSALYLNTTKPFAAVLDYAGGKVQSHFNMGVFSIAPNATQFLFLNNLRRTFRTYKLEQAEQGLLNYVYSDHTEVNIFPFAYNGNIASAVQKYRFWYARSWAVRIIHYTWVKPFYFNVTGHKDYERVKGLLLKWNAFERACGENCTVQPPPNFDTTNFGYK